MFYTVYKITNKINLKYYIGVHKTKNLNDNYMGSGKLIKRAIEKYGVDNFHKEYLHIFDNQQEMFEKEKELIVCDPKETYNLTEGGRGGWDYVNKTGLNNKYVLWHVDATKKLQKLLKEDDGFRKKFCENIKKGHARRTKKQIDIQNEKWKKTMIDRYGTDKIFLGKKHSEEAKQKMRKSKNVGKQNSQYGTCWITDGKENKKIPKHDIDIWIKNGYYKGRIV